MEQPGSDSRWVIREKTAKGYREVSVSRQPDRTSQNDGTDSGLRCQLLNPVEETELDRLLDGTSHCLQEKHDGRRLMVRKKGDGIIGINRRGLLIPVDVLIDGEAVGGPSRIRPTVSQKVGRGGLAAPTSLFQRPSSPIQSSVLSL